MMGTNIVKVVVRWDQLLEALLLIELGMNEEVVALNVESMLDRVTVGKELLESSLTNFQSLIDLLTGNSPTQQTQHWAQVREITDIIEVLCICLPNPFWKERD